MPDLKVLHDALAWGLSKGALIHEKTGTLFPVEVLGVQSQELIAVAQMLPREVDLLNPPAKIRIELPRETSVIYVPGRIAAVRRSKTSAELEILCAEGAEDRQRRMDVRIDTECRLRIGLGTPGEQWEETRTINLAAGGALVVSDSKAKVGETIEVQLELGGEVLHCKAEVLRRGVKVNGAGCRNGAALRFLGLDDALRDKIALHVLGVHAREKLARSR